MPAHPHHSSAPTSPSGSARPATAPDARGADRAAASAAAGAARSPGSHPGAAHLAVEGLGFAYPDRRVLSDVTFTARPGDRIGLVGENGTGKSTLLRLLAGDAGVTGDGDSGRGGTDDGGRATGTVSRPGSVGLLAQELPYPNDAPVARVLDDAQRDAVDALARLESLGAALAERPDDPAAATAYADALEAAERTDAWSAEARRGDVVAGLGLGGIAGDRPVGALSGGQRLRLALAALLLRAPHLLLLDEPSNHLDDAAAAYLERVLVAWPGIVVVASHDRALLDAITTRIIDLDPLPVAARVLADAEAAPRPGTDADADAETTDDPGSGLGVRVWGTGYSEARAERRREMRRWRERYARESEEIAALAHEIAVGSREVNRKHESKSESRITRKFYADKDARVTARRARNARVRLDALERERVRRPPEPLRFAGFAEVVDPAAPEVPKASAASEAPATSEDEPPVLKADRVRVAGRLRETSLALPARGRLLLTGPNGAGKSTLLAALAGDLAPDDGEVRRAARVGYLPQEASFADPARTARATYAAAVPGDAIPLEATGLIAPRDLDRPVGSLSVGQRRRVALAVLVAAPPPVLLLDEPTNHLSLTLVEELEEALRGFGGALVIASHDRWLRRRWEGSELGIVAP